MIMVSLNHSVLVHTVLKQKCQLFMPMRMLLDGKPEKSSTPKQHDFCFETRSDSLTPGLHGYVFKSIHFGLRIQIFAFSWSCSSFLCGQEVETLCFQTTNGFSNVPFSYCCVFKSIHFELRIQMLATLHFHDRLHRFRVNRRWKRQRYNCVFK